MKAAYTRRSAGDRMGRFGGGWQWKLGIQSGPLRRDRGDIVISLLVCEIRIKWGTYA